MLISYSTTPEHFSLGGTAAMKSPSSHNYVECYSSQWRRLCGDLRVQAEAGRLYEGLSHPL